MKTLQIPDTWGELDNIAQKLFGFGKSDALALLHDIANHINWSGEDLGELAYSGGWLEGSLLARRELKRVQEYPGSLRSLNSIIEYHYSHYTDNLAKINIQFKDSDEKKFITMSTKSVNDSSDLSVKIATIINENLYPSSSLSALYLLFGQPNSPKSIYQYFLAGLAKAYSSAISLQSKEINHVQVFRCSEIHNISEKSVFINSYIFESNNTNLLISAKLFINPLWEKSFLQIVNETNNKKIAEVHIENRKLPELLILDGQEKDILNAGTLLLDSVYKFKSEMLIEALRIQASKAIVAMTIEQLSSLVSSAWERPSEINIQRLKGFIPISSKYRNFIAPSNYEKLIIKISKCLSSSFESSSVSFDELGTLLRQLKLQSEE
ncbi:MAG: hypothetical protein GY787_04155 [Alteromonadales bacterium]|nr:hypothetical protein [Alteromonadales bacterium]